MAFLTYLTRAGGIWMMGSTPPSPRFERSLRHLSGSVLAALVATSLTAMDTAGTFAILAAVAVMMVTKRPIAGLLTAVCIVAFLRQ